jgi:AraC-like DNA-binding protein
VFFDDYPIVGTETRLPIYIITIGQNEYQSHVSRPEGFRYPQIIYCTKGSGMLNVGGTSYRISPNMGFFLPANVPHEYYTTGDVWDTRWITAGGYGYDRMLKEFGMTEARVFRLSDINVLEEGFMKMHEALRCDTIFGNYRASGLLYNFLIDFYRVVTGEYESSEPSGPLVKAIEYINHNYPEKITLEQLCDVSGVSKQHLCRLFRKSLNCRPTEYVAKRRIREAKTLLANTEKPIEQIAIETGFCTPGYLCELFKRYEEITPGEYRKEFTRD